LSHYVIKVDLKMLSSDHPDKKTIDEIIE